MFRSSPLRPFFCGFGFPGIFFWEGGSTGQLDVSPGACEPAQESLTGWFVRQ
jgi:hypothetical protein